MELIIEEISNGNKLIGRHKFTQSSNIHIGRGYHNHIILTDPHICPSHLNVELVEGQWCISDLDSVNGSILNNGKTLENCHVIQSGDVISIGKSQIRFLLANHPVPASIKFSVFESLIETTRKPFVIALSIFLFTLMSSTAFYLNTTSEIVLSKLLMSSVGLTLVFSLLPGIYTIISHLTKHEARFWAHLGISFIIFNLFWIVDVVESIMQFNLSSHWNGFGISMLISAALLYSLFWFNFFIGFHQSANRRIVFAASFTAVIIGTSVLVKLSATPEFRISPSYNSTLMSPRFFIAPTTDIQTFVNDANTLFEKTTKQANKKD